MAFETEDDWSRVSAFKIPISTWESALVVHDRFTFNTKLEGRAWRIRMNNFPDEPAYTLIVDDNEIIHFNNWPDEWNRPESRPAINRKA